MKRIWTTMLLIACTLSPINAQTQEWGQWTSWGDIGDGTYRNPIIPADFSDIDCIKVGNDYYAISSTMQFSPGMAVLHSRDLVNWDICSHVISDLTQISADLNWNRMNQYGRGVWAGSIRWHRGRFYVIFGTPDNGYFISSAKKAEGPWSPLHCLMAEDGWDDCCIDWDEKGQPWFVGTCFKDGYSTYIMRISKNMKKLDMASRILVNQGMHREANKLIEHEGWHYLIYSEHTNEEGRYVMAKRSRKIEGPYSEAHRLTWNTKGDNEPNQGGIIEGPDGKWYFLTHHGTGSWEGRDVSLLPVTWKDGWPEIGRMTWSGTMPGKSSITNRGDFCEEFSSSTLNQNLEWNYQPRKEMLSLTERKGHLRLKAFKPLLPNDFLKIGNMLTWRIWRSGNMTSTVKIDLEGMTNGTHCGLCVFSPISSSIGISSSEGKLWIEVTTRNEEVCKLPFDGNEIYMRCTAHQNGFASFSFSTDSVRFQPIGTSYPLQWGYYRGARMGIFCYNDNEESGYADFDFVHTETDRPENVFGHALVPDMIADASIIDVDGTFYCYATTDGYGRGLETSGPPVVWTSKDFVNWSFEGTYFPQAENEKYWAPSKAVRAENGKWYIYPTVNGYMYPAVADTPDGPFCLVKGNSFELPNRLWEKDKVHAIDTEIFIDDNGSRYAFWGSRNVARLKEDMATIDTAASTAHGSLPLIETRRKEYSEGPIFFKRKGIYYYLYTIGGDERYEYYYQMSKDSPLGPYRTPEHDLVCTTSVENGVFGPGHGCVFNVEGTDDYYLAFLEFGRNSTNRQTYVNRLLFNDDGTIRQVEVTMNGTGALRQQPCQTLLAPKGVKASSTKAPNKIRHFKDSRCQRTEYFVPEFAIDGANGSRWMAEETDDASPWLMLDLGMPKHITNSSIAFVRPTAGHAYCLEGSLDGETWVKCGGNENIRKMSPHCDNINATFRYLRVTIFQGVKGIWEWKIGTPSPLLPYS